MSQLHLKLTLTKSRKSDLLELLHRRTELAARLNHVNHDHTYACASYGAIEEGASQYLKSSLPASEVIHLLYEHHVILDAKVAAELEKKTRKQATSELWHSEHKNHYIGYERSKLYCICTEENKPKATKYSCCFVMEEHTRVMLSLPIWITTIAVG